ncbi:3D domain-containing protein, partial [Shouchella shacheensis]|uniref:3D domain-containing protein n=1 Tax=Shouchella shacheensis TaxID=1649580 RepID=UPI000B0428C4
AEREQAAQAQAEREQAAQAQAEQEQAAQAPAADEGQATYQMEATAYTANCEGCTGVTATGIDLNANPNQKVVAVDPDVIPLGSRVHVEGYGEAIAGDTGGAINGQKIDLYVQSRGEALNFGRQTVNVTVLD